MPFRGKVDNLGYRGAKLFQISCDVETLELENWTHFEIELGLDNERECHVTQEKIIAPISTVPLYQIASEPQGTGRDVLVEYNNFAGDGNKPKIPCSSHMAIFTELLSEIRFRPEHQKSRAKIPRIADNYVRCLSGIVFLEPEPNAMRDYGNKDDRLLEKRFVRSLPEQDIEDIGFIETARGEVML